MLIEFSYPQVKRGEVCLYFIIRGTIKSHEKDGLIPIEYFLLGDITVLRCIFPSLVGARENKSDEQNISSYYLPNHRRRNL